MEHVLLEQAIVKYITKNPSFNCSDLYISSDEEDNNSEIIAYVNDKPRQCRPDVIAHNFWGEKFFILGEAKSSSDFNSNDPDDKARHGKQIDVMLNALKVKRDIKKYLIYACDIDFRNEIELLINQKKLEFDANDVNIIMIDQINNPELFSWA
tara:strand:- start:4431 stop:4889 length:459 start_codon:yes stop_codon:yes gene_type:complete